MLSTPTTILDRIVDTKREEVARLRPRAAELRAAASAARPPRGFAAALRTSGEVRLLAEVKRRSPSAGPIRPEASPAEVAAAYEQGGAGAVSVLTDRDYFAGELRFLPEVAGAVSLPLLRKDFTIDPLQLVEARGAGADGVLLIARILDDGRLAELHALAAELGMDALVEVHDEGEMERALGVGATLIGINNRDLATFTTDLGLSLRLGAEVPRHVTLVAESGITNRVDVERLGEGGIDAILVGEALMRRPELVDATRDLVGVSKHAGARPA